MTEPIHKAAELFPLSEGIELDELVASMKRDGFDPLHPVLRWKGKVVDGRNRLRAAQSAGVDPVFHDLPDNSDPWMVSWRENGARRHLSADQKAAIWLALLKESGELKRREKAKRKAADKARAEAKQGTGASREAPVGKLSADIAAEIGVGHATVERVLRLAKDAPEAFEAVQRGETTANKELRRLKGDEPKKPRAATAAVSMSSAESAAEDALAVAKPEKWECPTCGTFWPDWVPVGDCAECKEDPEPESGLQGPLLPAQDAEDWDEAAAIAEVEQVFDEVLRNLLARNRGLGMLRSALHCCLKKIEVKEKVG
jgi:ParB-like chromosome segregation protein Spo0J